MQRESKGCGLLNSVINALPFELHIPKYQFCGPGTRLQERLLRGDKGINPLDAACKIHDIAYSQHKDLKHRHAADKVLGNSARQRITAKNATFGERAAATTVWAAMKAKTKMGMGLGRGRSKRRRRIKSKKGNVVKRRKNNNGGNRKVRILPVAKRGGFIPFLLPALSAIGALTGGAAGVYKAVNDAKVGRKQLEEIQRHNRAMEGRGLYLTPYTRGGNIKNIRNSHHHRRRYGRKKKKSHY